MQAKVTKREDMIRSGSLAFRRRLPPMEEPAYAMGKVERPQRDLKGSVIERLSGRSAWLPCLAEMVLLCNEASRRQHSTGRSGSSNKPLSLEYMADRLDTDDPLWGYTVRSEATGELQGFVTLTNFTTWTRWFRWDSGAELAGIQEMPHGVSGDRQLDYENAVAPMLEGTVRDGDPDSEGVVWPHIAEVSLLGALGCGKLLMQLVVDELEHSDSHYDFIVLQATENAIPFYESNQFVRVGAVARYTDFDPDELERLQKQELEELHKEEIKDMNEVLDLVCATTRGKNKKTVHIAEAFLELPDKRDLPEYYQTIKRPLSLSEVREKANSYRYPSLKAFEADLKLIFNNAKRFNAAGSRLWLDAEALEAVAARRLDRPTGRLLGDVLTEEHEMAADAPDAFWRKLKVGLRVDACDPKRGHWHDSKVVQVDDERGRVKIHFQGWGNKYDEWYDKDSEHLRAGGKKAKDAIQVECVLPCDTESLIQAACLRVNEGSNVHVTTDADASSQRLGSLRPGQLVRVTDRYFSEDGSQLKRVFVEQTINFNAPARGWANLRTRDGRLNFEPLVVNNLDLIAEDTYQNNGAGESNRRKRKRGRDDEIYEPDEPLSLGLGVMAGCTPCKWYSAKPDETPASIAADHGLKPYDIVFLNRRMYAGLTINSRLHSGTRLRIPRAPPGIASAPAPLTEPSTAVTSPAPTPGPTNAPGSTKVHSKTAMDLGAATVTATAHPGTLQPTGANRDGMAVDAGTRPATPGELGSRAEAESACKVDIEDARASEPSQASETPSGGGTPGYKAVGKGRKRVKTENGGGLGSGSALPVWYPAKENETPRQIASKLKIDMAALIAMNQKRYPGLTGGSRLRRGTKLRVPRRQDGENGDDADQLALEEAWKEDPDVVAYRHWTFPDDKNVEDTHPSYMMARPLTHRKRGAPGLAANMVNRVTYVGVKKRSNTSSTSGYRATLHSAGGEGGGGRTTTRGGGKKKETVNPKAARQAMQTAVDAMKMCYDDLGRCRADLFIELPPKKAYPDYYQIVRQPICIRQLEQRIQGTDGQGKAYATREAFEADAQRMFDNARTYNLPHSEVYLDADELETVFRDALAHAWPAFREDPDDLFNKVVRLEEAEFGMESWDEAMPKHELYYVLTYIPDLQWCRLGPLQRRGHFPQSHSCAGQDRWMLVRGEEHELDVSARRCKLVKCKAVKKTVDADNEEWVIPAYNTPPPPTTVHTSTERLPGVDLGANMETLLTAMQRDAESTGSSALPTDVPMANGVGTDAAAGGIAEASRMAVDTTDQEV